MSAVFESFCASVCVVVAKPFAKLPQQ